jgi:hypothetical protein
MTPHDQPPSDESAPQWSGAGEDPRDPALLGDILEESALAQSALRHQVQEQVRAARTRLQELLDDPTADPYTILEATKQLDAVRAKLAPEQPPEE